MQLEEKYQLPAFVHSAVPDALCHRKVLSCHRAEACSGRVTDAACYYCGLVEGYGSRPNHSVLYF